MAPAGVRGIGSAMVDAGFEETAHRLAAVEQAFPAVADETRRADSGPLHGLEHGAAFRAVHGNDPRCPADRPGEQPLIIAGGPHAVYQPYELFGTDPADPNGADVAVTGEEFVLMSMLEVLLSMHSGRESMRSVFYRAQGYGRARRNSRAYVCPRQNRRPGRGTDRHRHSAIGS